MRASALPGPHTAAGSVGRLRSGTSTSPKRKKGRRWARAREEVRRSVGVKEGLPGGTGRAKGVRACAPGLQTLHILAESGEGRGGLGRRALTEDTSEPDFGLNLQPLT
eukprot:365973-Chlamydomonas_euryale.AAC.18